jgi:hypothetical protein
MDDYPMSQYLENSKHAAGTAAVEKHFGGGNQGQRPGSDSLLKAAPYGSADWNPTVSVPGGTTQAGLQNTAVTSRERSEFNPPGQSLPRETGVNYKPAANAGHTVTQDPFQLADGFPGN